jgi:hypothetical protein
MCSFFCLFHQILCNMYPFSNLVDHLSFFRSYGIGGRARNAYYVASRGLNREDQVKKSLKILKNSQNNQI